jgi:hypothetical protein
MTSIHYLNVGRGDCAIIQHPSGRASMVDICGGNLPRAGALTLATAAQRQSARAGVTGTFGGASGLADAPPRRRLLDVEPTIGGLLTGTTRSLGLGDGFVAGSPAFGTPPAGLRDRETRALIDAIVAVRSAPVRGALSTARELIPTPRPRGNFGMDEERKNPLDYFMRTLKLPNLFRFISSHLEMDHLDGLAALMRARPPANFWWTGATRATPEFGPGCPYKVADWNAFVDAVNGRLPGLKASVRLLIIA